MSFSLITLQNSGETFFNSHCPEMPIWGFMECWFLPFVKEGKAIIWIFKHADVDTRDESHHIEEKHSRNSDDDRFGEKFYTIFVLSDLRFISLSQTILASFLWIRIYNNVIRNMSRAFWLSYKKSKGL